MCWQFDIGSSVRKVPNTPPSRSFHELVVENLVATWPITGCQLIKFPYPLCRPRGYFWLALIHHTLFCGPITKSHLCHVTLPKLHCKLCGGGVRWAGWGYNGRNMLILKTNIKKIIQWSGREVALLFFFVVICHTHHQMWCFGKLLICLSCFNQKVSLCSWYLMVLNSREHIVQNVMIYRAFYYYFIIIMGQWICCKHESHS